jgi:two-component system C4-dicarboxylate transport response regulator DctD
MNPVRSGAPSPSAELRHLNILLVQQEDPSESELLREIVHRRHALVAWERDLRRARVALASIAFDVVVADERLSDGTGLALVADPAGHLQRWATILLTECADPHSAASAIKRGAAGVVERAGGAQRLVAAIEQAASVRAQAGRRAARAVPALRTVAAAPPPPRAERSVLDALVGATLPMQRIRDDIRRLAPVPVDVMVVGETGTGKDLVLQQLHALSGRPGPLVAMNCGAIPDTLFESELFGHEAGAFTGAARSRTGKFEQAHRGTLFLDEIDSMPLNQQVKLLRVLETRRVDKVGGGSGPVLDLRVVAASQSRLDDACRQGRFRLDLWHRLNVVTLELPPLRERLDDLRALWQHHVDEACARYGIDGSSLPAADLARLAAYRWPGNVRELKHAAERFVLGLNALPEGAQADGAEAGLTARLACCERELIAATLTKHGYRLLPTATELGISEKTLSRRIAAYRLDTGPRRSA